MDWLRRWFLQATAVLFTTALMPQRKTTSCTITIVGYSPDGSTVMVSLTAKPRPSAKIANWQVEWGDGAVLRGTGNVPLLYQFHTYQQEGSPWLTLTVWDDKGGSGADSVAGRIVFRNALAEQDSGISGVLQLAATFECISIRCPVTGDSDDDATALVQYRQTGSGTWKNAHTASGVPFYYDNRATLHGGGTNDYKDQFRGSIVGLSAGTSYDVRVTVTDPDSGSTIYQDSVSTLASTPPLGGTEYYIDDGSNGDGSSGSPWSNSQWATAMSTLVAGDTLHVRAGTYSPLTWTKSGSSSAWISIVGDARDSCIISGTGATNAITVDADYVQFKNLRTTKSNANSVEILANQHHVWFDNVYNEDIAGTDYSQASFLIRASTHHVYLMNCTMLCPSIASYGTGGGARYDDFGAGVYFKDSGMTSEGTFIMKGCTVDGKFRDGVGNEGEVPGRGSINNTDIYNNTFNNIGDDCIQMEDEGINLRIWGNHLTVTGLGGIATQSSYVGPVYVFRNTIITTNTGVTPTIWKSFDAAKTYFLHNSIRETVASADLLAAYTAATTTMDRHVILNNILASEGGANCLYAVRGTVDYNLYYRTSGTVLISDSFDNANDYEAVGPGSQVFTDTGQEEHGVEGDPVWVSTTTLTINASSSPARNVGKVIANFNDADSAWPYSGAAPDIGQHEAA